VALREVPPAPVKADDLKGTVWESLSNLKGSGLHPFQIDSPSENESAQLVAGEVRRITYRGSGEVLQFNPDLPIGVTLALVLDGTTRKFSRSEAGLLRWDPGLSPFRFQSSLELVITNTTGVGQPFHIFLSGA
jgi:hypothetical protein